MTKKNILLEILFSVVGLKKIKGNKELEDAWTSKDFDIKAISQYQSAQLKKYSTIRKNFFRKKIF